MAIFNCNRIIFDCARGDYDPMIYPCPIELKKELMKAYAENYTFYPEAGGNADLKESISEYEREWNGLTYKPDEMVVGCGGGLMLYTAFRTIVEPDDGVVCLLPSPNTKELIERVQGVPLVVECVAEDHFLPRPEMIQPLLRGAVLLPLAAPMDPAGTCFSERVLQEICMLVVMENRRRKRGDKKLYLLYDIRYAGLRGKGMQVYDPVDVCPDVKPYVVYINSASKIFSANGIRVGWAMGPVELIREMTEVLYQLGGMAPMAEQKALARFLPQGRAIAVHMKNFRSELYYVQRVVYTQIKQMKTDGYPVDALVPKPGLFLAVHVGLIGRRVKEQLLEDGDAVAQFIHVRAGVAVKPFSSFGMEGSVPWFRMAVGMLRREDIRPLMVRMQEALRGFRDKSVGLAKVPGSARVSPGAVETKEV
jgi:aspartate aminotransferase